MDVLLLLVAVVALVSGHHLCIFARDADGCGGVFGGRGIPPPTTTPANNKNHNDGIKMTMRPNMKIAMKISMKVR